MLSQETKDNGQSYHSQVMGCEFLVPCRHAAKPLQTADAPLNDVSPPVGLFIELALTGFLVLAVSDDRLDATFLQPLTQPTGRVRLVSSYLRRLLWPSRRFLQQRDG